MLALDHRGSLKKLLHKEEQKEVSEKELIDFKVGVIGALAEDFSGVLIDVEYGLPAYKKVFEGKKHLPYLLCMEKSGYREKEDARYSELQYSARKLKELGASGAKLLLYLNPFVQAAPAQIEISQQALAQAHEQGLPLFLEIVTYETKDKPADLPDLLFKSLEIFLEKNILPDVFKLEYPGSLENCQKVTKMLDQTPWILLTRGERFDVFRNQLKDAIAGGAVGFLAGRALWQEAVNYQGQKREDFFTDELKKRFQEISKIALTLT